MANANASSPAQQPRRPTTGELGEPAAWPRGIGHAPEAAKGTAETASVAVFDDYRTDGPGYCGTVLSVI